MSETSVGFWVYILGLSLWSQRVKSLGMTQGQTPLLLVGDAHLFMADWGMNVGFAWEFRNVAPAAALDTVLLIKRTVHRRE